MPRPISTSFLFFLALVMASCAGSGKLSPTAMPAEVPPEGPRNVILFISDGTGPATMTMTRDFLRHQGIRQQLYLDEILTGALETWSAANLITGSGAAATALATGHKGINLTVGQDAEGNPVRNIVEKAEAAGLSTGVVVTREVYDATPASFTAHADNRYYNRDEIVAQQVESGIDLLVGGGWDHFIPAEQGGRRRDGRKLLEEARDRGYSVSRTRAEWDNVQSLPAIAVLGETRLPYELDRDPAETPSLAEMTRKAIDLLNAQETGFFLLVEGSLIDLAGHNNDAAAHVRELISYDDAVKVALDFAKADGQTLLVATSDHETGGLAVGSNYTWNAEVLATAKASHDIVAKLLEENPENVVDIMNDYYGISDLSEDEITLLTSAEVRNQYNRALGKVVGDRAYVHWASLGHTAVDVNLYAFGPGSEHFRGHFDNTYIGQKLPEMLRLE